MNTRCVSSVIIHVTGYEIYTVCGTGKNLHMVCIHTILNPHAPTSDTAIAVIDRLSARKVAQKTSIIPHKK